MARPASGRSDAITRAPLVMAAELGEAGMVLQMLSDTSNGGRQWLRENPEGRVAAILELIASRTTTDIETSKKLMETIEIHHKGEAEAAGYKKHMYYKGADWAGESQAAEAAEELREMGRLKGTACESQPCMNGGVCTDLLQDEEDDMYNLDGAYDRCPIGVGHVGAIAQRDAVRLRWWFTQVRSWRAVPQYTIVSAEEGGWEPTAKR